MSVLYFVSSYLVIGFVIGHLYAWFEGGWHKWTRDIFGSMIYWPVMLMNYVSSKDYWRNGKAVLPFLAWCTMRLLAIYLGVPLLARIDNVWIYYPLSFIVLLVLDYIWFLVVSVALVKNSI